MPTVHLRKLEKTDAPRIAQLLNHKKVWDNLRDAIPFPYSLADAEFFLQMVEKQTPQQTFAIVADEELCGIIGLVKQTDVYSHSAEIGYWLGEAFWGKGIATQAVRMATSYGFWTLGLRRIYACVFSFNLASMQVLEKNGYEKEAILKKAVLKNGIYHDEHRYALCKF